MSCSATKHTISSVIVGKIELVFRQSVQFEDIEISVMWEVYFEIIKQNEESIGQHGQ